MEAYAKRLAEQIKEPDPILIGVSFGGMIAVEVARLIKTKKIIIISSTKTRSEIPFYYKLAGVSKLNKLIGSNLFSKMSGVNYFMFGVKEENEKQLLKEIIRDTDPQFLDWATDKIVNWKNEFIPENLKHIHGTADKILPLRFIKSAIEVLDGEHFMIVSKGKELSTLVRQIIES